MILYDSTIPAGLLEFGILIPIRDSRATKTFEALCSDSHLGSRQNLWHRQRISEDCRGLFERHAVLADVALGLEGV